ncbi:MAG TPA: class I mannose-6-phosphate isomerase [Steroidobacteraceae bacterium]
MPTERTGTQLVAKPWGRTDLRPWHAYHGDAAIGEVWFNRSGAPADSTLLLKLLFTTAPLSIQVHPSDAFARSIGLAHGKSEAWYVLSALPHSRVALGLTRPLSPTQLRAAIEAGSIAELVQWHTVRSGDVILVSPGTIHSIGPGLVIAEIQQRSAATFRLFDYGRTRELHTEDAVAAAGDEQLEPQPIQRKMTEARTLLLSSPHFVLERFELLPGSSWELAAGGETWLFMLAGHAQAGSIDWGTNESIFLQGDSMRIQVGPEGLQALAAYAGSQPDPNLLRQA